MHYKLVEWYYFMFVAHVSSTNEQTQNLQLVSWGVGEGVYIQPVSVCCSSLSIVLKLCGFNIVLHTF